MGTVGPKPALEGLHGGRQSRQHRTQSHCVTSIPEGPGMAERTVGAVQLAGRVGWGESARHRPSQERD